MKSTKSRSKNRKSIKLYKKRSNKTKKRTYKFFSGGNKIDSDVYLAYPANDVSTVRNPHLAFTGKGGNNGTAYPSNGPPSNGYNFLNSQIKSGGCGSMCGLKGGSGINNTPYPNGLIGQPWGPKISSWPGVDGVDGNRNYLPYNTYNKDVQLEMQNIGANPPFLGGGGKRKPGKKRRTRKNQKGGDLFDLIPQGITNMGRQLQFDMGSTYNSLNGYRPPTNPLPTKDQMQ